MATDADDDEEALKARRDRLAAELKARQPKPKARAPSSADKSAGAAWSLATKAGSEFVAAIIVGGAIGYALDFALKTKPTFTIVFFMLGVVAGVWNVIRATSPKDGGTAP